MQLKVSMISDLFSFLGVQWACSHVGVREVVLFGGMVAFALLGFEVLLSWSVWVIWSICNMLFSDGLSLSVDISFISVCNGL